MEEKKKSLANLQEAFRGSLDPEVVDLILTESNYVVDDALAKLLSISKSVSSSDLSPNSENKSAKEDCAASIESTSPRPNERNSFKGNKKAHKASSFRDDKSNSLALLSKGVDYSDVEIYSSVDVTNREIPLESSEKLSNSIEKGMGPKDLSLFDHNHQRTNSTLAFHGVQSGIEVTDQAVLPNELPPWPDYSQGYLHHMHSLSGQPSNVYQGLPIHTNFQGQRITGDAGYFHYMPQHQSQQNMGTYHPRSSFHVPRIRYPPVGWYPGQVTPQNGTHFKKNKLQPHFGMQREERQIFSKNQTRSGETFLPSGKVLVMLRGLPGSGKTTLAQKLKGDGLILSTDDFFLRNGKYQYEQNDLSEAHEWNQKRAKESMQKGVSPVIIDNTNTQAWEMRPYVSMGRRFGYKVIIKEPDTPWKWNTKELLKRNQHQVTSFGIQNMKERYEKDLTVEAILATNREKNENVNPKDETCHSNKDKAYKDNNECVKSMSVAPKERNCNKETSHNKFIQETSSASKNHKDVSSLGATVQSQFENQRNKQVKPFVAQPKPSSSSQLGNQGFKYSKARSQDTWPEMKTLRSHGSRSPIQDIDFSLAEPPQDGQSLEEINETFNKIGIANTEVNFDETLLPKPQRTPKKRERASKLLENEGQNNQEVKENPYKVLESREAKTNKQGSRAVSENDEEEGGDDNVQGLIARVANEENSFTHCSRNEIHLDYDQEEQEISFLRKEVVASNAIERNSMISHKKELENTEPLLPKNLLTTDESKNVETISKELFLESYLPKDIRKSENDKEEQRDLKAEDYSLAKTNDWNETFKGTRIASGFWNREEKTKTEKEHSLENFQNDLIESDLSGFQFLNTCFPDMDIQFLVEVLAKNQGDVTKAVESILCHEDSSSRVELSREKDSSDMDESENLSMQTSSSQRKSAYIAPDQDMEPLQCCQVQESRTANSLPSFQSANKSFQMTLEPAVAIHLLELFGPIDSVSLEGDFSSDDLIVKVDLDFAKLLYNQWRTTFQNDTKKELFYTGKQPQVSRTKRKADSDKIFKEIQPKHSLEHRKTTDLRQIMDEQMAIEQSRQEQLFERREQTTESMAVVLKRQKLYAMFPGVDPLALEELFEANRYELQPTVSMVETSCNLQAKLSEFQEKKSNSNTRSCDDGLGELKTEFQALQDPDYVDFRAEANTHYKLRDECFRKAAFAFSKKQGQLAQFYASQGHMHTEKIRQANRRAAARILEYKNSSMDQNSLDLHGLHVDEALSALEEKLLFSDSQQNQAKYLSVITGQGIHSKQGKAKIKPAVVEYLQRNNYRFEELQPGLLRVSVKR